MPLLALASKDDDGKTAVAFASDLEMQQVHGQCSR